MKTALITGNKGFIGSEFQRRLDADGWSVEGCDIVGPGALDCEVLFRDEDSPRWDLVVHAAAYVGGRLGIENEPLRVATDLALDSKMFEWAARTKQRRVLYFSSSAAYPMFWQSEHSRIARRHLREQMIAFKEQGLDPDMTYGWTKIMGEILAGYARNADVPVTVVRPFSGYGSTQSTQYPFPSFIDRALRREDPFTIWGDGLQERDFIHVDDIYAACMALIEDGTDLPVNLGTGRATSFNELARLCAEAAGYEPAIEHLEAMPVGSRRRVADCQRLHEFCVPKVALEEGIERALRDRAVFV